MENVTILIANHNLGHYLPVCLDSVIGQSSPRWRVIIVDDASTDGSEQVYRKYAGTSGITVHHNDTNLGYIATLKKLIELSETDIVGILDPDDALAADCVGKVMEYYDRHPSAGFVYTNFWYCDEELHRIKPGYCRALRRGDSCLRSNCVSHFRAFRRSVYCRTEGFDETLTYAEDRDLALKMEEVTRLHFINEPLYYYRVLPDSQSHGPRRSIGDESFARARELAMARRRAHRWGRMGRESAVYMLRRAGRKFERLVNPVWWLKQARSRHLRIKEARRHARYRDVMKDAARFDRKTALENITAARGILAGRGMRCWLTDGTLLGFYRDRDFIAHDIDIDLGCYADEFDAAVIMDFVSGGWMLEHLFGTRDQGLELSFRRHGVKCDIFFFYRDGNTLWHGAWQDIRTGGNVTSRSLIRYRYDSFSLKEADFLGTAVLVPEDTEKYVETKYGPGWRTPVKEWDWAFGPANAERTDIRIP